MSDTQPKRFTTIRNAQDAIDHWWPIWFPEPEVTTTPPTMVWDASDQDVIDKLRSARNSAKFEALYDRGETGDYAHNDSEADLALLSMLSFYTQDPGQLDRLFRGSKLYRAKWERPDYRDMTISRALDRGAYYEPPSNSESGFTVYRSSEGEADPETGEITSNVMIFNQTDLGNARRLVNLHGSDLRYCGTRANWTIWNGSRWEWDDIGAVMQRAKSVIPAIHAEAAAVGDQKAAKALLSWAKTSESGARIREMVKLSEDELPVRVDDLDADPWLMNVRNGTIDLRTGDLLDHDPARLMTKISPIAYDPNATCPTWERFLNEIMRGDTGLITFLQRSLGYSLTGSTRERAVFFLYGVGRNGKSTFLETVSSILGDYATVTPPSAIIAKRGDDGIPNDIARLSRIRFTSTSETGEFDRLNEAKIKAMSGEEAMTARFMRGEWFDFNPEFKLWLATNHKPIVRGTDDAIWDRIKLVPFLFRVNKADIDFGLKDRLLSESSGILAWMVQGCLDWQASGLQEPQVVRDATTIYRDEMDPIGMFITEECVTKPGVNESATALYRAFQDWLVTNGEPIKMSQRMFGMRLKDRGFVSRKGGHTKTVHYDGIRLKLGSDEDHPVYDHTLDALER